MHFIFFVINIYKFYNFYIIFHKTLTTTNIILFCNSLVYIRKVNIYHIFTLTIIHFSEAPVPLFSRQHCCTFRKNNLFRMPRQELKRMLRLHGFIHNTKHFHFILHNKIKRLQNIFTI